jgi:drug/metabolite transporter superfamily protein YnfA
VGKTKKAGRCRLLTLQPFSVAGRVYAGYGGIYIAASLGWF